MCEGEKKWEDILLELVGVLSVRSVLDRRSRDDMVTYGCWSRSDAAAVYLGIQISKSITEIGN